MGIWEYSEYFDPKVEEPFRLTSNEGNTLTRNSHVIATMIGVPSLYLKREDLNPSGSHKDRAVAYQLSAHIQDGAKSFVLSSSGNAAISAIMYSKFLNHELHLFLSPKLPGYKQHRFENILEKPFPVKSDGEIVQLDNFTFHFSNKAVSQSIKFAKETNSVLLRGSTDPYAVQGYKTIAFELIKQVPSAKEIFIPVSSGTAAIGIYEGYKSLNDQMGIEIDIPEIHVVQTTAVNTFARAYDKDFKKTETSIVDSITDRVGHRKKEIDNAIQNTNGSGWVIKDDEIIQAENLLKFANVSTSYEGVMAVAAVKKALAFGRPPKNPVCIITGSKE